MIDVSQMVRQCEEQKTRTAGHFHSYMMKMA